MKICGSAETCETGLPTRKVKLTSTSQIHFRHFLFLPHNNPANRGALFATFLSPYLTTWQPSIVFGDLCRTLCSAFQRIMEASDKSITRRRPASEDVLIDEEQDQGLHSFDGVVVQHGAYVGPQTPAPNQESHLRSVVKGLTWRILATTTTTISMLEMRSFVSRYAA